MAGPFESQGFHCPQEPFRISPLSDEVVIHDKQKDALLFELHELINDGLDGFRPVASAE